MRTVIAISWIFLLAGTALAAPAPTLESVLNQMDATAATFKSAEADFVWDQYQEIVMETDTQAGKVYFRKSGKQLQMAAHINSPVQKYVLYADDKVRVYEPRIDQVTEYGTGKNRADVESFLVLGFGGRGHDLLKSFEVKLLGSEAVDGVQAAKLELVPKSQKARNMFERILLWIDPARGLSVRQQFFEKESGNYRLARYSNIKLNQSVPDDAFRLKTTGKTKTINPQG